MKKRRFKPGLDENQQMFLGLLLVFLLAISMLYCLGLASLVLRQTWESAPLPWNEGDTFEEELDLTITPVITPTDDSSTQPSQSFLMIRGTWGAEQPTPREESQRHLTEAYRAAIIDLIEQDHHH